MSPKSTLWNRIATVQVSEVFDLQEYRDLLGKANASRQFGYHPILTRRRRVKDAWKSDRDIQDTVDWKTNFYNSHSACVVNELESSDSTSRTWILYTFDVHVRAIIRYRHVLTFNQYTYSVDQLKHHSTNNQIHTLCTVLYVLYSFFAHRFLPRYKLPAAIAFKTSVNFGFSYLIIPIV